MVPLLVKGANASLQPRGGHAPLAATVTVTWRARTELPIVLLIVACDERGRAVTPTHTVTYETPTTSERLARFDVQIDLTAVPASIPTIAFALATQDTGRRSLADLTLTVCSESGDELARYPVTDLPAWSGLVVAEVYRRSGQWKVRAIGQEVVDGYAGLRRSFALVG